MPTEGEPHTEVIRPGQLYFLAHPGSDHFSGYGLTTHDGRKDRLAGLLMVDRPHPADPAWLAELEHRYGDYQLWPMTATGERGLLAQMRVAANSLNYLSRFDHPIAGQLNQALQPLLDALPTPVLKLRWDDKHRLWRSDFWMGLPDEMQAVFEKMGYGCFAAERADNTVAFITHASDRDIRQFRGAPVLYEWQYIAMPTAPLIRHLSVILDNPASPYRLEHFLNVGDPDQARGLSRLVSQPELSFDFYGEEFEYAYSTVVPHPAEIREGLAARVRKAIEYYGEIPAARRDFDRAKAEFQRAFPLYVAPPDTMVP